MINIMLKGTYMHINIQIVTCYCDKVSVKIIVKIVNY